MKTTLCLFALFLAACSAPKYNSVNQSSDHASASSRAPESEAFALYAEDMIATTRPAPAPVQEAASSALRPPAVDTRPALTNLSRADKKKGRQQLKSALREFKQRSANPSSTAAGTNPKNNGFAIAGFVLSIVGWLVLWPLVILGIIFSAIGLNSERKGLAMAGLILGIVGVIILLVVAQNNTLA